MSWLGGASGITSYGKDLSDFFLTIRAAHVSIALQEAKQDVYKLILPAPSGRHLAFPIVHHLPRFVDVVEYAQFKLAATDPFDAGIAKGKRVAVNAKPLAMQCSETGVNHIFFGL